MKVSAQKPPMAKVRWRSLSANESCPKCGVRFMARAVFEPGRSPYKVCPDGHETAVHKLAQARKAIPPKPEQPVAVMAREVGITGDRETAQLLLAAMVGCYDRLIDTTPGASHGVIDGIFANTTRLAKRFLGGV